MKVSPGIGLGVDVCLFLHIYFYFFMFLQKNMGNGCEYLFNICRKLKHWLYHAACGGNVGTNGGIGTGGCKVLV